MQELAEAFVVALCVPLAGLAIRDAVLMVQAALTIKSSTRALAERAPPRV